VGAAELHDWFDGRLSALRGARASLGGTGRGPDCHFPPRFYHGLFIIYYGEPIYGQQSTVKRECKTVRPSPRRQHHREPIAALDRARGRARAGATRRRGRRRDKGGRIAQVDAVILQIYTVVA
jgi:hypothetical protein